MKYFLLFCLVFGVLEARPEKKYNLSVCAIFKNESKDLKEWIEYHRLVGVDHFYLYDNGSSDRFLSVLRPYINKKIVSLISWPDRIDKHGGEDLFKWALSTQVTAYENVLHLYAKRETKWLVFLDIAEFLVPVRGHSLPFLLEEYGQYPALVISRDFFDAADTDQFLVPNLVIESVERTKAPICHIQESVEKTIFKPDQCISFSWPPYQYSFKNHRKALKLDRGDIRINGYLNRHVRYLTLRKKVYTDHRRLGDREVNDIFDLGYNIEDQERVIHRFVPDLLRKL